MIYPGQYKIKTISMLAVIFSVCLIFCGDGFAEDGSDDKLPNVIICTLSGVRNSESIHDESHQYIPNLWNKMLNEGTLYTNLINLNLPFHQPSVQAINTGRVQRLYARLNVPTIFQYIIKKYRLPVNKAWSVGHWHNEDTISFLNNIYDKSTIPSWLMMYPFPGFSAGAEKILTKPELNFLDALVESKNRKICEWPIWDINEEIQYRIARRILETYKPKIMHYVSGALDSAHFSTFGRYVLALKNTDEMVFGIWEFIKSDPFYKDNTYLFVVPDHSRNSYYMQHSEYPVLNQTWLYVYGPDVKKNIMVESPVHHVDIFATIARIMNVETYPTEGKVLKDCFTGKKR